MKLTDNTVTAFVAATASEQPVPGGGSISALCGALSAALGRMVCGLTIGKKKYANVQADIEAALAKIVQLPEKLSAAVDLDSEAYDKVFQAYKLPKDTEEEKAARKATIEEALKYAARVPMEVAEASATLFPVLEELTNKGNQNAVTDVYVATLCVRTAVLGACANVSINLSGISDTAFVDEMNGKIGVLKQQADIAEAAVTAIIMPKIS